MSKDKSYKTAITRKVLAAPTKLLLTRGLLSGRILDYGCGKGFCCDYLGCEGYDPYYRQALPTGEFDTIYPTYVLNVVESSKERALVVRHILSLLKDNGKAYISVRKDLTALNGYTTIGTWQGDIELNLPVVYKKKNSYIIWELSHASCY